MSIPINIQGERAEDFEKTKRREPAQPLTESEIWELAEHLRFARIGTSDEGRIHITPVNVAIADQKIYFRTAPGSKLTQLILNDRVTLQFDRIGGGEAYSVNIFGTARLLTDSEEIARAESLNIVPWINTAKLEFVEITPDQVVGRKFLLGK
ncbi:MULTISPECIES: pyridoxamine 5'-phosphate oxidase family protein [unclassified Rothia (in: high G+C Gram-positive bacteria)]|uniref:pyridoxamine 5'-phosphate oxidase family protein n=1 Tax=unclassified Rothia (in: high G+C Gram-positive bacteria) TaxID=2689056 RepID=UPI001957B4CD|nr:MULTISPECIES: pyridoxamine 5'-phosphate oxidase family protein [unclassified Rothia (in: high G+C Gram-positive bacteria)]MBM7051963.1 pyridoxamine 5'-phosphate oxidase family protein [Rothia sp. ZJ1223]QRZ61971.1 pyridoxamine 5'-phosphate oxidase family protein [Rothia sp. ZJ932]